MVLLGDPRVFPKHLSINALVLYRQSFFTYLQHDNFLIDRTLRITLFNEATPRNYVHGVKSGLRGVRRRNVIRLSKKFAEDFQRVDVYCRVCMEFYVAEDFLCHLISKRSVERNKH